MRRCLNHKEHADACGDLLLCRIEMQAIFVTDDNFHHRFEDGQDSCNGNIKQTQGS